jgi:quercetin dioxygenase-like cupin family protein
MDEIADPNSGQRWVFHRIGGEVLEADLYVNPGGYVPAHVHPAQQETFTGVSGTFFLDVAGERRTIGPGDSVTIPPRTPHGFKNASEQAQLHVEIRPALRLDRYFRAFLGLSRDGKIRVPSEGLPSPLLQVALVMGKYAPEVAAARVPLLLQRALWWILRPIARLKGYRDSFAEYGAP